MNHSFRVIRRARLTKRLEISIELTGQELNRIRNCEDLSVQTTEDLEKIYEKDGLESMLTFLRILLHYEDITREASGPAMKIIASNKVRSLSMSDKQKKRRERRKKRKNELSTETLL